MQRDEKLEEHWNGKRSNYCDKCKDIPHVQHAALHSKQQLHTMVCFGSPLKKATLCFSSIHNWMCAYSSYISSGRVALDSWLCNITHLCANDIVGVFRQHGHRIMLPNIVLTNKVGAGTPTFRLPETLSSLFFAQLMPSPAETATCPCSSRPLYTLHIYLLYIHPATYHCCKVILCDQLLLVGGYLLKAACFALSSSCTNLASVVPVN